MESHFGLLVIFAALVSLVFALLAKNERREQLRLGAWLFCGFVGTAVVLGWLMYPFPF